MMLDALAAIAKWVNDWLLAIGTGVVGLGSLAAGVMIGNLRRSKRNERRLEGDPDDPNNEGLMDVAHETREELEEFRREAKKDHEEVREMIEDLADDSSCGSDGD